MKRTEVFAAVALLAALPGRASAQVGGNAAFTQGGGRAQAEQNEKARRALTKEELPATGTASFVDASVLMNVKADEFVAVFAVSREGETPADCVRKMDETVKSLLEAFKPLGVVADDVFVDFVAQPKVYGFQFEGNVATEKQVGFELKKNVSVRYKEHALIDRLLVAAAKCDVYDLVKVDYVVKDTRAVRDRLAEAAAGVVKQKSARYEKLFGITLKPPGQVYAERATTYYPSQMYDAYTAASTEDVGVPFDRQRFAVHSARKGRTFFYNGLDGGHFDEVINPVVLEPVVQFTLYLKLKYEVEQPKAR